MDHALDQYSVIAYYGTSGDIKDRERFYRTAVGLFRELGYPPDKIGITGKGYAERMRKFAMGDARLSKTGFAGVRAVEIVASLPDAVTGGDYHLRAEWSASDAVFAARSSIAAISDSSMLAIATAMAEDLRPEYGIGYNRLRREGPEWFAVGICHSQGVDDAVSKVSGEAYEERLVISRWGDAMDERLWRKGILRDVYPWNFLTRPQLSTRVGAEPLERWVRQDARRGTLKEISGPIVLWEVRQTEIPQVRDALHKAAVLFDWRVHL